MIVILQELFAQKLHSQGKVRILILVESLGFLELDWNALVYLFHR